MHFMSQDPSSNEPAVRFAAGEYYSPMYDTRELVARKEQIWPAAPRATIGIDWRVPAQLSLCHDVFAQQAHFAFPTDATENPTEYYAYNTMYPPLDAWILEGMIRHHQPARMIEIGCGFSTLVSARVNREFRDSQMHLTCIEPYPRPFLTDGVVGVNEVLIQKVQDVPLDLFMRLTRNDILFIDTSHTVKTGGDVTWIFHEILPRLTPGVLVHIHDFFLPGEYPEPWVLEGWGWNETYLAQSFLMFNDVFEIVWGSVYMLYKHPRDVRAAFPDLQRYTDQGAGSLWIRRRR